MSKRTATTTRPLDAIASRGAVPADDQPRYAYAGNGTFLPANDAAWREVERWNAYADAWNTYTATRSAP